MAGLVPAIHAFDLQAKDMQAKQDVDARDKRGHDESTLIAPGARLPSALARAAADTDR